MLEEMKIKQKRSGRRERVVNAEKVKREKEAKEKRNKKFSSGTRVIKRK